MLICIALARGEEPAMYLINHKIASIKRNRITIEIITAVSLVVIKVKYLLI